MKKMGGNVLFKVQLQTQEIFNQNKCSLLHQRILFLGTALPLFATGCFSHLNGKIGDIRSWDEASECFKVHFEDEGLEPCPVKDKFLRILFELPEES